jgi:hypothetical protein
MPRPLASSARRKRRRPLCLPSPLWGGAGGGGPSADSSSRGRSERRRDRVEHGVDCREHHRVREAEHAKSLLQQPAVTLGIPTFLIWMAVATTVEFDDQSRFEAAEIHDIGPDRHLTTKVCPFDGQPPTKRRPEQGLGRRRSAAQGACARPPPGRRGACRIITPRDHFHPRAAKHAWSAEPAKGPPPGPSPRGGSGPRGARLGQAQRGWRGAAPHRGGAVGEMAGPPR